MKYLLFWILSISLSISISIADEAEYVSDITFTGNLSFPESELRSIIKLRSPQFFARSNFSAKKLNRDKISLEAYYKSKGYLEVEITEEYIYDSKKYIKVNFIISEGKQYKLKALELYGNKLFSDKQILNILNVSINQYYNPAAIRKELKLLKRKYMIEGKLDIAIMDEITIEGNYVTARINISEGNTYQIQKIYISGLKTTKEKYVFRELTFSSGELYNVEKIDESKNRIFNSGLFSSVEMKHHIIDNEIGLLDININIREYKSSSIEGNFGFEEWELGKGNLRTTGLYTNAKWVIGNVFNRSSNIEISGRLASGVNLDILSKSPLFEKDLSVTYRNPWTLFFRLPFKIKYFHEEELDKTNNYKIIEDGITYSLLFNKDRSTRYEINSTVEMLKSHHEENPLREINIKFISNKIHNPLNPEGGQYISLISSLYGTILGGERHYYKLQGEYRKYQKILNNSVFAFRIFFGFIENLDDSYELDYIYKFRIGGQTSLRGWDSPRAYNNNGALINDLINLEYRFPIWKKIGGEFFIDCGRLYNEINHFMNTEISWDYGIGLIYKTTLGPIRIDMGFPYGDLTKPQPHASLLYMF